MFVGAKGHARRPTPPGPADRNPRPRDTAIIRLVSLVVIMCLQAVRAVARSSISAPSLCSLQVWSRRCVCTGVTPQVERAEACLMRYARVRECAGAHLYACQKAF